MSATTGKKNAHDFKARLVWDGNLGEGTSTYTGYGRKYRVQFDGKPDLPGSADPIFRGDPDRYNPEDLFVASISSCHLLTYLSLCARSKINVVAYEDDANGTMVMRPDGGGKFESVTLRPKVTIAPGGDEKRAMELHETAHDLCFIAASVSVPVRHEPQIKVAQSTRAAQISAENESRA
jgi:organic hydroperoxide reductase OsmC/OhrA